MAKNNNNKVTYKNLFSLVDEQIQKRVGFNTKSGYSSQLSRVSVSPKSEGSRADVGIAELVVAVQDLLSEAIPSYIISGLTIEATDPISSNVTVSAGKGSAGGFLYELSSDATLNIPFDSSTYVFYITLYKDAVYIDRTLNTDRLTIGKIVVPNPGVTSLIQDTKDESWNAYIVNFKEYKLYGKDDKLEEDTVELLRDNIGDILADNLIGNIRLSENLKILNTEGTLEINSDSLKLYDISDNLLSKFNRNGVYFYNESGIELAKFTGSEARVGNIKITKNSLESGNFSSSVSGFRILDSGDVEFNDAIFRGTLYANTGTIGGWTINSNKLYATTTGIIQTSSSVGVGSNGVIIDCDGLRMYDSTLGLVVNLPSNGDAPTFSSGTIEESTFEINTNAVVRTSSTVGDGSSSSAGILINNTGLYGCQANQFLTGANLRALVDGTISISGEIRATSGIIGNTTISSDTLSGGSIEGARIISPIIETSTSVPKIRIDSNGIYYQESTNIGKYGSSDSGSYGFKYGDGTHYGGGVAAYLFNTNFPTIAIMTERNLADIRLYNRGNDPTSGSHVIGDLIVVNGKLKICTVAGNPGTFTIVGTQTV